MLAYANLLGPQQVSSAKVADFSSVFVVVVYHKVRIETRLCVCSQMLVPITTIVFASHRAIESESFY